MRSPSASGRRPTAHCSTAAARDDGHWTLGALRRGELYESTAVRELRDQAAIVAAGVCASLAQPADAPVAVPA